MAVKPENQFISSVHKYLPPKDTLHREKMNNPYSSGTADWWYSGNKADLWCEYKYLPKLPVRANILPELSELQKEWLAGRYREGRNVAVVVGSPEGAVVYRELEWLLPLTPAEFRGRALSRQELAVWLVSETTDGGNDVESLVQGSISSKRGAQGRIRR